MKLFAFVRRARRIPAQAQAPEPPVVLENAVAAPEKRRRRPSSSGSAAAPAWKPTLMAISEDAVVNTAAAAAKVKPSAKAKARSARAVRVDYDDFRHLGLPTVLPAFAPTTFLF